MTDRGHLQSVPTAPPAASAHGFVGGDGNGGLTRYRLDELERRMGVLENKVDDLTKAGARIETKLNDMPGKSYVLWIFGGTAAVLILSLVGHAVIRSFGP